MLQKSSLKKKIAFEKGKNKKQKISFQRQY